MVRATQWSSRIVNPPARYVFHNSRDGTPSREMRIFGYLRTVFEELVLRAPIFPEHVVGRDGKLSIRRV